MSNDIKEVTSEHKVETIDANVHTEEPLHEVETYNDVNEEPKEPLVKFEESEFYKNIVSLKDELTNDSIAYPGITVSEAAEMAEELSDLEEDEALERYTPHQIVSMGVAINGCDKSSHKGDILDKIAKFNVWKQANLLSNSENFGIRNPSSKKKPTGEISGDLALLSFNKMLGLGGITQIPLFHSGFWITLDMISEADAIGLEVKLGRSIIELGRSTNGTVFSNEDVIYNEHILEFVLEKIAYTSIDIESVIELRELILVQDMPVIILGLIDAITPKGMRVMMPCNSILNLVDMDDEETRKCDFSFTADIDPKKLLWINKDALDEEKLRHMSKRSRGSVTRDDVDYYKRNLKAIESRDITISLDDDVKFVVKLRLPNMDQHIEQGNKWIDDTIATADEILGSENTDEYRVAKVRDITKVTLLNTYIHYVEEIRFNGAIVKDQNTKSRYLDSMSRNDKAFHQFIDAIKEYIRTSIISLVGTPAYICPECKGSSDGPTDEFREIIPLNITSSFLDLSTLKKKEIMERTGFTA